MPPFKILDLMAFTPFDKVISSGEIIFKDELGTITISKASWRYT